MPTPTRDIETEADITHFLSEFYARVRQDPALGPIFDDVAQVDWPHHLPRIAAFWSTILLGTDSYRDNVIAPHLALAQKAPITPAHFDRWLTLFTQTLAEHFTGPHTEQANIRAQSIAVVLQSKLYSLGLLGVEG